MADIRINALANTASTTASDDFLAVDGTTNGTRKLSAYSPTFGGNFQANGTGTIGGNLTVSGTGNVTGQLIGYANAGTAANFGSIVAANATLNAFTSYSASASTDHKYWAWQSGTSVGDGTFRLRAINDTATNGINALTFTRSGISSIEATIGGNLTVSGTGTSTFGGNVTLNASGATLSVINANGLSSVLVGQSASSGQAIRLGNSRTLNYGDAMVSRNLRAVSGADTYQTEFTGGYGAMEFSYDGANSIATRWIVSNSAQTANTAFTPSYAMTLKGNGNFLLGTPTDSGNGKLQLATHTTSAGGIGFGTDTALYRTAAGEVGLDALSGTSTVLGLRVAGTRKAYAYWESGTPTFTIAAEAASSSIKLLTANTLALTLDSSQNATFAGKVLTASGTAAAPTLTFSGDSDTGFYNPGGNQVAAAAGGGQIWNTTTNGLSIANGKDIYLGNAYVAGAPTATGYVVIKDSTGTSYKIPAVAL